MDMKNSRALFEQAQKIFVGGVNSPVRAFRAVGGTPPFIAGAAGAFVVDVDGHRFIDYVGSWGPAILGHAHPEVLAAVREAAARGLSFGAPHALEFELAREIQAVLPTLEKIRFTNSGTEAAMAAIRLARGFTGRDKILKFNGCYHGHADSLLVKAGSGAQTLGVPDSRGVPEALAELTLLADYNDLDAVRRQFAAHPHGIACVLVEPVMGNMGCIPPGPGFLAGLQEVTREYGCLLICDEVMTGFRVAPGGAQELFGIRPDLTLLGKIIGGGLPVGAVGGRAEIMDYLAPLGPVYQAGTLSGNPLAMASGLATLRCLQRPGTYEQLEKLSARFEAGVKKAVQSWGIPVCFQRQGSMFSLFFHPGPVRHAQEALAADSQQFRPFFHHLLAHGIYIAPSAFEAGFISLAHTEQEIDKTIAILATWRPSPARISPTLVL